MLVTAVKQTTIMSDNITAYSTAVGPSSLFKKRFNFMAKFFMWVTLRQVARNEPSISNETVTLSCYADLIAMISTKLRVAKLYIQLTFDN